MRHLQGDAQSARTAVSGGARSQGTGLWGHEPAGLGLAESLTRLIAGVWAVPGARRADARVDADHRDNGRSAGRSARGGRVVEQRPELAQRLPPRLKAASAGDTERYLRAAARARRNAESQHPGPADTGAAVHGNDTLNALGARPVQSELEAYCVARELEASLKKAEEERLAALPKPRKPRAPKQKSKRALRAEAKAYPLDPVLEASRCRALLLEVIRRAAHDWVLYRNSTRLSSKKLAQSAALWLFEEDEDHPAFKARKKNGTQFTAFICICELLDLEPDAVRYRIKQMEPHSILCTGRPAERRRARTDEEVYDSSSSFGIHTSMSAIGDSNEPLCQADKPWGGGFEQVTLPADSFAFAGRC